MCTRAQIANPNPRQKRASPRPARHGSVLRPCPRKAPKRSKRITTTTIATLIPSSRDHGTRPLFIEKAATSQYSQNAAHPMARRSSTTPVITQTATAPSCTRRGAQVLDRTRLGRKPSRDPRRRRAEVRTCRRGPLFLHESSSTVLWLRHMRWWRRRQLAIPIVWASGYERAKARHLVPRQNRKYCLLNSQPRPATRTMNIRRSALRDSNDRVELTDRR